MKQNAISKISSYYKNSASKMTQGKEHDKNFSRRTRLGIGVGILLLVLISVSWCMRTLSAPLFDSSRAGNLSGNSLQGGFAVEGNGEAYVAYETGIYAIKSGEKSARCVAQVSKPCFLNYFKGKLYFASQGKPMNVDPQTGEVTDMKKGVYKIYGKSFSQVVNLSINEGEIYVEYGVPTGESDLYEGRSLEKINPDTYESSLVDMRNEETSQVIAGDYRYYEEKDKTKDSGGILKRCKLGDKEKEQLYGNKVAGMVLCDNKVYFTDLEKPEKLMRMDSDGTNVQQLLLGAFSYRTVATPSSVYYTAFPTDRLERVDTEGKNYSTILTGGCGSFCITKEWIFYRNKDDNENLWMVHHDGSENQSFAIPS